MADKLTMDDVDKKIEEMLTPAERPNIMGSLMERVRGRKAGLPKLPKLPRLPRV